MNERPLPKELIKTVNNLTQRDFPRIRTDSEDGDTTFVDEVHIIHPDNPPIQNFKSSLEHMYLPYFAERLQSYIATKPTFFIVDGLSAVPYAYMFKSAFREYQKLHPSEDIQIPQFLFMDISPMRNLRDGMKPDTFVDLVDTVQGKEMKKIWGDNGTRILTHELDILRKDPTATAIVFDEFSDPNSQRFGSLRILTRFIQQRIPTMQLVADSPEIQVEENKITVHGKTFMQTGLIHGYHIYTPFKRLSEGNGEIRRPSLVDQPIAHKTGLEFLAECRQLGKLIAQAA